MSCETLLPTNIDEKLNALDLVGGERVEELKNAIEKVEKFTDPLTIDEEFLELLADEFEVKFWSPIVELEKRKLINASKAYYRKLGTVWAIKEVLKVLDIESRLAEWFDYEGEPYHFKVVLSPVNKEQTFDENEFKKIVGLIDSVKNVRSVLDGFEFELFFDEEIKVYSGFSLKPKIDQNAKANFPYIYNVYTNCAKNTKIELSKSATIELQATHYTQQTTSYTLHTKLQKDESLELSVKSNFFNSQFYTLNPALQKEATIETTLNNTNYIQGVAVWQV